MEDGTGRLCRSEMAYPVPRPAAHAFFYFLSFYFVKINPEMQTDIFGKYVWKMLGALMKKFEKFLKILRILHKVL